MKDVHGDLADIRKEGGTREETGLNALELIALEQYYLGEGDRRARELTALENRLIQRLDALAALEARLTQRLNSVHALEIRLKQELHALGVSVTDRQEEHDKE